MFRDEKRGQPPFRGTSELAVGLVGELVGAVLDRILDFTGRDSVSFNSCALGVDFQPIGAYGLSTFFFRLPAASLAYPETLSATLPIWVSFCRSEQQRARPSLGSRRRPLSGSTLKVNPHTNHLNGSPSRQMMGNLLNLSRPIKEKRHVRCFDRWAFAGVVSSVLINCDDARISLNTTPCQCRL